MVFTIADIRAEFKRRLMIAPYGLSAEELNQVLSMLLDGMNTAERRLFARFDFWMMSPELDEQIICANVELVRFGVLCARLVRESKKKQNSGESFRPSSIAHSNDITKFLKANHINPSVITRRPDTVEARAKIVDDCINQSIRTSALVLPEPEDITPDTNKGNNRTQSMQYISVEELILCIARSEKASSLKDYAMHVMAALKIYNKEWHIAKEQMMKQLENNAVHDKNKIDMLIAKVDNQTDIMQKQTTIIDNQNEKIDRLESIGYQLLKYGRNADKKLDIAITKIDNLTKFITDFANTVLTTWIGSCVLKTQLDELKDSNKGRKLATSFECLKFAYTVSFVDGSEMITYVCCTNFRGVAKRLHDLTKAVKHQHMQLLKPQAIYLISSEVNIERAVIKQQDFPNIASISSKYDGKTKSFDITLMSPSAADNVNTSIAVSLRNERLQLYQMRMDRMHTQKTINLSDEVIDYLQKTDAAFYTSTTSLCQKYLDCYVITDRHNQLKYHPSHCVPTARPTINNEKMTDRVYILYQISFIVGLGDNTSIFDDMVNDGVITMENTDDLQKIADAENVDVSDFKYPSAAE